MITGEWLISNTIYIYQIKNLQSIKINPNFSFSQLTVEIIQRCIQYDINHRLTPDELYSMLQPDTLYSTPYHQLNIGNKVNNPIIYNKQEPISVPNDKNMLHMCEFVSKMLQLPSISVSIIQGTSPKDNCTTINVYNESPYLIIGKIIYFFLTENQIRGSFMLPTQIQVDFEYSHNLKELAMLALIAKQCLFEPQQSKKTIKEMSEVINSFMTNGNLPPLSITISTVGNSLIFH